MVGRRLFADGSLYLVATLAPTLTLLAITPIVTRALGAPAYGAVAIAITVYQLTSILISFGLPLAITRHAILGRGGYPAAVGIIITGSGVAVATGAIVALTSGIWGRWLFPAAGASVLSAGVVAGTGLALITMSQALFRAAERAWVYVVLAALAAVVPPGLGLLFIQLLSPTPESYALGLAIGYAAAAAIAIVAAVFRQRPLFSWHGLREAYLVGLPTLPHLASLPLLLTGALAVVTARSGIAATAEFQIAIMLGSSTLTVLNALNNAWAPMIMKTSNAERRSVLEHTTYLVSVATLLIVGAYIIAVPIAMPLIGGPVVGSDIPQRASIIISASCAFQVIYLSNIHLVFISGKTGPIAFTTPLSACLAFAFVQFAGLFEGKNSAIIFYSIAWPLFFATQAVWSIILARRTKLSAPRLASSVVPLALVICAVTISALSPNMMVTVITIVGSLAATALYHHWFYRRRSLYSV